MQNKMNSLDHVFIGAYTDVDSYSEVHWGVSSLFWGKLMWSNLSFKGSDGCNVEINLFKGKGGIRLLYTLLEKWCWRCYMVVQLLSHVWLFVTPWTTTRQASLSFTISQSLLKLMSIELVMPSNHLTLCRPLLLPPSIFPSIRVWKDHASVLHIRWPNYWSFNFSISPSTEYSELISFRID